MSDETLESESENFASMPAIKNLGQTLDSMS